MARFVTKEDLEAIADSYLEKYVETVQKSWSTFLQIDPTALAEQVLDLAVYDLPLSSDLSILGMSQRSPVCMKVQFLSGETHEIILQPTDIAIEASLKKIRCQGQRNFTIAHEVGHHMLWRTYPTDYISSRHVQFRKRNEQWSREEWQANYLAGALLMPRDIILRWMKMINISPDRLARQISIQCNQWTGIQTIAQGMGVSTRALTVRLYQLEMLNPRYRVNEKALDVWRDHL